ncbi:MAG: tetratricopeptide repeat protein [Candidatus Eremiobacteraeota bacterium]|nr:tetratricopeptide repeat protein [Candidatus Eremiobacteraeota bacterium]
MSGGVWPPRQALEETLVGVEGRLAAEPADLQARFDRAKLLEALGRNEDAQQAYFAVLELDPRHFGTLNNLGNLFHRMGYGAASHAAYEEAVKWHPEHPVGHANLANAFLDLDDLDAARAHYEKAVELDPDSAEAHQGLNYVFTRLGDDERAAQHRLLGFRDRAIWFEPFRGEGIPTHALLLVSAIGGNVYTHQILDDRSFLVAKVFAEAYDPSLEIPPHDFVFNAIGDADRCRAALERALEIVPRTRGNVVNDPAAVLRTGRVANAERLGRLEGVRTPRTVAFPKSALSEQASAAAGIAFPFLLRAPGHHTGSHFERVANAGELAAAREKLPGNELLAIEYLDTRAADGKFRKYRVMIVDGEVYPLHLAIGSAWMLHYYTAEMEDYPAHRSEEERFLNVMPAAVGARAVAALDAIRDELALDYAGIDFTLDADGNVVVFEANATMTIPAPPKGELWAYRVPAVERVLRATKTMFERRAGRSPGG